MTRRILPFLAAITILVLMCWSFWTALAGATTLEGDAAAWTSKIESTAHVPLPTGPPITVLFAPCPGLQDAAGCTIDSTIWVDPAAGWPRFSVLHELGHQFDSRDLDPMERLYLIPELGGFRHRAWGDCGSVADLDTYGQCPLERFADAYAFCALGAHVPRYGGARWYSPYGYLPQSEGSFLKLCSDIRAFADPN